MCMTEKPKEAYEKDVMRTVLSMEEVRHTLDTDNQSRHVMAPLWPVIST